MKRCNSTLWNSLIKGANTTNTKPEQPQISGSLLMGGYQLPFTVGHISMFIQAYSSCNDTHTVMFDKIYDFEVNV